MVSAVSSHSRGVRPAWSALVVALATAAVVIPFLFWQSTWFGRPLSDQEMDEYLTHLDRPRRTQHALSQLADRMMHSDRSVRRWYPALLQLSRCSIPEIREMVAWAMGQDNSVPEFQQALHDLLRDRNPLVRMNAALALVRFGDASGHAELRQMLLGMTVSAPASGMLRQERGLDDEVGTGALIARVKEAAGSVEIRSPIPGSLGRWLAEDRSPVRTGQPVAWIRPAPEVVWEALRGMYLIGQPDDLDVIAPYARGVPGMPAKVALQARATADAIRQRAKQEQSQPEP
jgi:hypothetical protein